MELSYVPRIRRKYREAYTGVHNSIWKKGEHMKKLLITGIALCSMAMAVPGFSALRQDQSQQDQMKKDDGMKHDNMSKDGTAKDTMAKDAKSKKKMKKDEMKKDEMKKDDGMKKDDMSKDAPKN